jgi:RNA polymerase sigma factor (sigma-70 family)
MCSNKLFDENTDYADTIASCLYKKYNNLMEYDDIKQLCLIGLFNASKTFDVNKKTEFKTYANKFMRSEVINELRKLKNQPKIAKNSDEIYDYLLDIDSKNEYENGVDFIYSEINLMDILKKLKYDENKHKVIASFLNEKTQSEIAVELGVSRQWIFQIISSFKQDIIKYLNIKN